jgi:hypothetical protein
MAKESEELNSCILFTKQFLAQINPFEIVFYGFDIYYINLWKLSLKKAQTLFPQCRAYSINNEKFGHEYFFFL